jgi:hypothetical protein
MYAGRDKQQSRRHAFGAEASGFAAADNASSDPSFCLFDFTAAATVLILILRYALLSDVHRLCCCSA